jgi:hypothetical protein
MPQLKRECLRQLAASDVALRWAPWLSALHRLAALICARRAWPIAACLVHQLPRPTPATPTPHRHAQLVLELARQLRLPELQSLEARALAGLCLQLQGELSGEALCKVSSSLGLHCPGAGWIRASRAWPGRPYPVCIPQPLLPVPSQRCSGSQ